MEAYIVEQQSIAMERRDRPWFLDDENQDEPSFAETSMSKGGFPFPCSAKPADHMIPVVLMNSRVLHNVPPMK